MGPQPATFKRQIHLLSLLKTLPCRDRFVKWLPSSLTKYTTQMGPRRGCLLTCPPPSQHCAPQHVPTVPSGSPPACLQMYLLHLLPPGIPYLGVTQEAPFLTTLGTIQRALLCAPPTLATCLAAQPVMWGPFSLLGGCLLAQASPHPLHTQLPCAHIDTHPDPCDHTPIRVISPPAPGADSNPGSLIHGAVGPQCPGRTVCSRHLEALGVPG